jgi:hypothetical protein
MHHIIVGRPLSISGITVISEGGEGSGGNGVGAGCATGGVALAAATGWAASLACSPSFERKLRRDTFVKKTV